MLRLPYIHLLTALLTSWYGLILQDFWKIMYCVVEILSEQEWNGGIYYFDAFKGYSVFREKQ